MSEVIEGTLVATPAQRFAIIVARWNELVTLRLLEGAIDTLVRHGAARESLTVIRVPGSFELPLAAQVAAKSNKYHAVICLGAVIQGQTTHHEYINHQVAAGLTQASQDSGVPVLFGVLTCQTMEQALDRAGGKAGNKGTEAALAAIEMVNLLERMTHAS
jgi:6,7-dimethyl-8-ribityllumazine synthase